MNKTGLFEDEYQGGPSLSVFSVQGSDPVKHWKLTGGNNVQKVFEKTVKSSVYNLLGGTHTKMQLPKDERKGMKLFQPYLIFQLFVPQGSPFALELTVSDTEKVKHRLYFSTAFKEVSVTSMHARLPLTVMRRGVWLNLCIDMPNIVEQTFKGTSFASVDLIEISPVCKLRKIFTQKHCPPDDTDDCQLLGIDPLFLPPGPYEPPGKALALPPSVESLTQVVFMAKIRLLEDRTATPGEQPSSADSESRREKIVSASKPGDKRPMQIAFGSKHPIQNKDSSTPVRRQGSWSRKNTGRDNVGTPSSSTSLASRPPRGKATPRSISSDASVQNGVHRGVGGVASAAVGGNMNGVNLPTLPVPLPSTASSHTTPRLTTCVSPTLPNPEDMPYRSSEKLPPLEVPPHIERAAEAKAEGSGMGGESSVGGRGRVGGERNKEKDKDVTTKVTVSRHSLQKSTSGRYSQDSVTNSDHRPTPSPGLGTTAMPTSAVTTTPSPPPNLPSQRNPRSHSPQMAGGKRDSSKHNSNGRGGKANHGNSDGGNNNVASRFGAHNGNNNSNSSSGQNQQHQKNLAPPRQSFVRASMKDLREIKDVQARASGMGISVKQGENGGDSGQEVVTRSSQAVHAAEKANALTPHPETPSTFANNNDGANEEVGPPQPQQRHQHQDEQERVPPPAVVSTSSVTFDPTSSSRREAARADEVDEVEDEVEDDFGLVSSSESFAATLGAAKSASKWGSDSVGAVSTSDGKDTERGNGGTTPGGGGIFGRTLDQYNFKTTQQRCAPNGGMTAASSVTPGQMSVLIPNESTDSLSIKHPVEPTKYDTSPWNSQALIHSFRSGRQDYDDVDATVVFGTLRSDSAESGSGSGNLDGDGTVGGVTAAAAKANAAATAATSFPPNAVTNDNGGSDRLSAAGSGSGSENGNRNDSASGKQGGTGSGASGHDPGGPEYTIPSRAARLSQALENDDGRDESPAREPREELGSDEEDQVEEEERTLGRKKTPPRGESIESIGGAAVGGFEGRTNLPKNPLIPPFQIPVHRAYTPPVIPPSKAVASLQETPRSGVLSARRNKRHPSNQTPRSGSSASVKGAEVGDNGGAMAQDADEDDMGQEDSYDLDLIYDPILNCYYDPKTNKYYELK